MKKVIVVGGGYAGISAATSLAEKGFAVELLESRGFLGGRVYSTTPTESFPAPVDNGPHLFMGCYREAWKFLDRLGSSHAFHRIDPLRLSWIVPGGEKVSLRCAPLPAPFHLAWGLLTSNAFSFSEKIRLACGLAAFSKKPFALKADVSTVVQFLNASNQGPQACERFWIPLCNAVMNVPPETAPIRGLGEVLHRIFFGSRKDSALVITGEPLSNLGFREVADYLERRSGAIHFHEGVQKFIPSDKTFELTARSGKTYTGDALVWAVPPSSLSQLWPSGTWPTAESFPKLGKSPILSVHLIVSQPLFEEHLVGLSGAQFEWVFNRNANWGWKGVGQYLSLVTSAAEKLTAQNEKELVDLAVRELRDRLPASSSWEVLHSKVTCEMAATFIWNQETDKLRPPCETPYSQVFLAGDWTDTGLPATIEGACFSGHRAAQRVEAYLTQQKRKLEL